MSDNTLSPLRIGWASTDVTPEEPVFLAGQFHARISEGVLDPLTATALALEQESQGKRECAILVSVDILTIPDPLARAVRRHVTRIVPDLDPRHIVLNATHTHTGPEVCPENDDVFPPASAGSGVDLPAMDPAVCGRLMAERIGDAAVSAWQSRRPGRIASGLGHAVVSHNRRVVRFDGETTMYGATGVPDFSHIEGCEDHSLNLIATWDNCGDLTGLVVNVPCPAQVTEGLFQISADYWHETRHELRRRFGERLFVLPQCSAAGDQSPHVQVGRAAEEKMLALAGRTWREEIAKRVADGVSAVLPLIERAAAEEVVFRHDAETIAVPRRRPSHEYLVESDREAGRWKQEFQGIEAEVQRNPSIRGTPRWYVEITSAYRQMRWSEAVRRRFERTCAKPSIPVELHVLRLGDTAIATNPFEYYLDFGMRIRARSKAVQTVLVQLAGGLDYAPTRRAVAGGGYGAVAASTVVGPEGGQLFAEKTIEAIEALFAAEEMG